MTEKCMKLKKTFIASLILANGIIIQPVTMPPINLEFDVNTKSGICPKQTGPGICLMGCFSDSDCKDNQKCVR